MSKISSMTVSDRPSRSGINNYIEFEKKDEIKYFDDEEEKENDKMTILTAILTMNYEEFELVKLLIDPRMNKKMIKKYYKIDSDGLRYKIAKFNKKYPQFKTITNI